MSEVLQFSKELSSEIHDLISFSCARLQLKANKIASVTDNILAEDKHFEVACALISVLLL